MISSFHKSTVQSLLVCKWKHFGEQTYVLICSKITYILHFKIYQNICIHRIFMHLMLREFYLVLFVLFYMWKQRLWEDTGLARIAKFVIDMPKFECKSLELEFHCFFIIHLLKSWKHFFPKTNDSRDGLWFISKENMTPGLYLFQVSIGYNFFKFFPQLAQNCHVDKKKMGNIKKLISVRWI